MATTPTPAWISNRDTLTSDPTGMLSSADVNQYLGTHAANVLYQGSPAVSPNGSGGFGWEYPLATIDADQPFTMSGTVVGRVEIPVLAVGNGADLLVSLCADNVSTPGTPGTVIQQTRVPASWIYQLSGVAGLPAPSSQSPVVGLTGNQLATPQFNQLRIGSFTGTNFAYPAISSTGVSFGSTGVPYDTGTGTGYLYLIGGTASGVALSSCFSISGNTTGAAAAPVPQPTFPQTTDGSAVGAVAVEPSSGTTSLVIVGGAAAYAGAANGTVYVAAINSVTGNLGAWSAQTSLPENVQLAGMASYNGYVYVVGGQSAPSGTVYNTVYYAQVQNSQITGWTATIPLPVGVSMPWVSTVGGKLIVSGGSTTANPSFTAINAMYYAQISANGSIGAWVPGPNTPAAGYNIFGYTLSSYFGTAGPGSPSGTYYLGFNENGPAPYWTSQSTIYGTASELYMATGPGTFGRYNFNYLNTFYLYTPISVVPTISVPLPATGLTTSTTYHILMQQQGGDLNNYLYLWDDFGALPGNFVTRTSPRGAYTWSHVSTAHQVPVQIFDQTALGLPLHTWEDSGARISTIVRTGTPDLTILGLCESTLQPAPPLNQTWNFNNGLGQWTATGGSIASSTAHLYQQLSESALLTPTGAASLSYLTSDLAPVILGHTYTCAVVCFSTVGYASVSANINWYTSVGGLISTTSGTVSAITTNTWTRFAVAGSPPATAAYGQVVIQESGTPPATALLYVAYGTLTDHLGIPESSVTQITYGAAWPSPVGPPLSTVQLA